ncbi:FxLYD domain-containing protein [Natrononativus amylolyticus]|uniref:FxLYD domain-containing protein n=1 Tax=Natrononativus amylolyticus TaxID=2963434 RepID=UPI0020CEC8EC|nr:FxLYD domain-containing protein [Natrononativus amylolyticus]
MRRTEPSSRRYVLGLLGTSAAAVFAGCSDVVGDNAPTYVEGTVEDAGDEERSPEEMVAAEALAEQEVNEGITELDALSLVDHEFVIEDDFRGPTVQGTVENVGDDRIQLLEVRVRVYNDDGELLGRYLDVGGDLDAGDRWAFEVVLLESPAEIDRYEIAVLGTPA